MNFLHNLILIFLTWNTRGKSFSRFQKWLELETYKDKIVSAVENGHPDFPKFLLAYLSTAFDVRSKWFENANWELLFHAFYVCISKSPKLELPITMPSAEKSKEDDWTYEGRTWHLYSHMLARTYGWTLEYIADLTVFEAFAKIQEIVVDEQLEREFYYGLSEVAYSYDQRSKTSKFNPLPRPYWMRPKPKEIKKFIIPASMLPVGVVVMDGIPDDYKPKEIDPKGNVEGLSASPTGIRK